MFIYIYIYCHPQTDCFAVSQLFGMAICIMPKMWKHTFIKGKNYINI